MNMIGDSTNRECGHTVLASNASDVSMKTVLRLARNQRLTLDSAEDHVDEAGYITVRHRFSRPIRDYAGDAQFYPARSGKSPNRAGLFSFVHSGLAITNYGYDI